MITRTGKKNRAEEAVLCRLLILAPEEGLDTNPASLLLFLGAFAQEGFFCL